MSEKSTERIEGRIGKPATDRRGYHEFDRLREPKARGKG